MKGSRSFDAALGAGSAGDTWTGPPNAPGASSYRIAATTFVLMYKHRKSAASRQQAREFFSWAFAKGQPQANSLDYVPLPAPLVQRISRYLAANIK